MTNEDILYKAILQAEKNGYKEHLNYFSFLIKSKKNLGELLKKIYYINKYEIIYSHSFAKAFFGNSDSIYLNKAWVHRLHEMSLEEDEFKYLEKFLNV